MAKKYVKEKKIKLNLSNFLQIIPNRLKRIDEASDSMPSPLAAYKPNQLAAILHPEKQYLVVQQVIDQGEDVKSFVFGPNEQEGCARLAPIAAGQYISICVQIEGQDYWRPYSVCSSPKDSLNNQYMLTIKRVPGGIVSGYILDHWVVGTTCEASDPFGEFTYQPLRDAAHVIALAGGNGITPFYSMMRAIGEGSENFRLTLLYGVKREGDILFKEELDAMAAQDSRIQVHYVLSDEKKEGMEQGFITADLIRRVTGEEPYSVFVCGPQAMYRYLEGELPKLGLRRKFIRYEVFGELHDIEKEADCPGVGIGDHQIVVQMAGQQYSLVCHPGDTILSAMEKAGVAAPSRCRSGECGYCHSRLVRGQVYVPQRVDKRREADKIYGYIHPCVTYPLSDLVIDVPPVPVKHTHGGI